MNKFVKNIIIFTVISFSAVVVKSDSRDELSKEIIYNYYDEDNDEVINTKKYKKSIPAEMIQIKISKDEIKENGDLKVIISE